MKKLNLNLFTAAQGGLRRVVAATVQSALLILLFAAGSCEKPTTTIDGSTNSSTLSSTDNSTQDTVWKLVGIVNTLTDTMQILKSVPENCENSFILRFGQDPGTSTPTFMYGRANPSYVYIYKDYDSNPDSLRVAQAGSNYIGGDGSIYYKAIGLVRSYSLNGNELKLFIKQSQYYGYGQGSYLLYNPVIQ